MDGEKPQYPVATYDQQREEEAVAFVAGDGEVAEAVTQDAYMVDAAEDAGAAWTPDDRAYDDEALANSLYMAELMEMERAGHGGFDEPLPAAAAAAAAEVDAGPAPAWDAAEIYLPLHRRADHQGQGGGGAATPHDVHRHERFAPQRPGRPVGGGAEAVTIRLDARTDAAQAAAATARWADPPKDAVISARQAMLAGGVHSSAVRAGMAEDGAHDEGWYECVLREAQMTEQPGEEPYYHCPNSMAAGDGGEDEDEDDPDEPGPSSSTERPPRVPPLADDEVPKFDCGICMETLPVLDLFHGMQCEHRFCVECMGSYIDARVGDGAVPIPCPETACKKGGDGDGDGDGGVLHPEACKKSIDFAAFSSWGDRLTERAIPASRRAYCPNRRCGVMLEATGGKTPAMAACPVCGHLMCATCGLDWSTDESGQHDCTEGAEAALVKKLAADRRWKQCPKCKMLVERTSGCDYMLCSCANSHSAMPAGLPWRGGSKKEKVRCANAEAVQC
ncbi:hypothetical protein ACP4OV_023961 [Aristida adscensionis]